MMSTIFQFGQLPPDPFPKLDDTWTTAQIIYTAFVSIMLAAALLEWALWILAFTYCFIKVYQKAETTGIKALAILMLILFWIVRGIFLPITFVTVPLPHQVENYIPSILIYYCVWTAFWSFAILLTVPWAFCIWRIVRSNIGKYARIKEKLDEKTAPRMLIVMPTYNEIPHVLMHAVDSAVESDYPTSCLHLFVSFDGDAISDLYLFTLESLGAPVPMQEYPISLDLTYRGARVTVSRFPHGGKRHCQKKSFKLIDKIYADYLNKRDDLFILFIDSDVILDKLTVQNFLYDMELAPGSRKDMLAMTGVITCTTEKQSLITVLQDVEYIHGQLFERSVESACGSVTCLPGALTCLRFSGFRKMAKYYFADKAEQCEDLFDFGKCHLGEDRWLTHLFMIGAKRRFQIQMCTGAFCKTEAVVSFQSLLKQRRRWFIGFITNEVCMLTDPRLWQRYPILCILRFMQDTVRTTALLFFIILLSLLTTVQTFAQLPVGFIAFSLGLNWALMLYFGLRLRRLKAWLYPLMFILNPFFNWLYMVYGIFTAGQRTWGGPRADASSEEEHQVGEDGEKLEPEGGIDSEGQPLEIEDVGEFKQPDHPIGLFPPELNISTDSIDSYFPTRRVENPITLHPRGSFESFTTMDSNVLGNSVVYLPQQLDNLMKSPEFMEKPFHRSMLSGGSSSSSSSSPYGYGDYDNNEIGSGSEREYGYVLGVDSDSESSPQKGTSNSFEEHRNRSTNSHDRSRSYSTVEQRGYNNSSSQSPQSNSLRLLAHPLERSRSQSPQRDSELLHLVQPPLRPPPIAQTSGHTRSISLRNINNVGNSPLRVVSGLDGLNHDSDQSEDESNENTRMM